MEILFLISLAVILYTYVGYGVLLYVLVRILRLFRGVKTSETSVFTPGLTVIVAAYNESYIIGEKIKNTIGLIYPREKLEIIFITDGSTDQTPEIVARYPEIKLMHKPGRTGKIVAVHRAMQEVKTEIVVFTDANTMLNEEALLKISRHYADPRTGAVAGEKRVSITESSDATAGEGFYWKYESALKKWDSELYSVVGAAGELFSVRTGLYEPVENDTLLDDFMISMRIAMKKYRIVYEPEAYAVESASADTKEELKRKIRISAGGVQSVIRLRKLFLFYPQPVLSFEFVSHRVLRWIVTPYLMVLALILNVVLVSGRNSISYCSWLLVAQLCFYAAAITGWVFEKRSIKFKLFFIPYYFCLMNYAAIAGMIRFFNAKQTVLWDKAKRK